MRENIFNFLQRYLAVSLTRTSANRQEFFLNHSFLLLRKFPDLSSLFVLKLIFKIMVIFMVIEAY